MWLWIHRQRKKGFESFGMWIMERELADILKMDDVLNVWKGTANNIQDLIFGRDMISTIETKNEYMREILITLEK